MIRIKETIERGTARPASVWEVKVRPDGKGGFTRKSIGPKAFQSAQKVAMMSRMAEDFMTFVRAANKAA